VFSLSLSLSLSLSCACGQAAQSYLISHENHKERKILTGSFLAVPNHQLALAGERKKEMGRACSTNGVEAECMYEVGGKSRRNETSRKTKT
jgi:hypothetical protein